MTTLFNGVLGGAFAALVASVAAAFLGGASPLPPLRRATTAAVERRRRGMDTLVAVGYGALAGGALVALELFALGLLAVPPSRVAALGLALGWSLLLCGVALVVWRRRGPERLADRWPGVVAFHLAFGLALGAWLRLTWVT